MPLSRRPGRTASPRPEPEVERRNALAQKENRTAVSTLTKRDKALASIQGVGGVHKSEIVVPSLILMQGQSPQLKVEGSNARLGAFYHPLLNKDFGKDIRVVLLRKRLSYELWGDRNTKQGLLATADENGVWDKPNHEFEVPYEDGKVVYKTRSNLAQSGLNDWGSWKPRSSSKRKAVALCYRLIFWLVDKPEVSPIAVTFRRMPAVRFQEQFISRMMMRAQVGEPVYEQIYRINAFFDTGAGQQYTSINCMGDGTVTDPDLSDKLDGLTMTFNTAEVIVKGETVEDDEDDVEPRARVRTAPRNYGRKHGDDVDREY
jgi:hypothetical protein